MYGIKYCDSFINDFHSDEWRECEYTARHTHNTIATTPPNKAKQNWGKNEITPRQTVIIVIYANMNIGIPGIDKHEMTRTQHCKCVGQWKSVRCVSHHTYMKPTQYTSTRTHTHTREQHKAAALHVLRHMLDLKRTMFSKLTWPKSIWFWIYHSVLARCHYRSENVHFRNSHLPRAEWERKEPPHAAQSAGGGGKMSAQIICDDPSGVEES